MTGGQSARAVGATIIFERLEPRLLLAATVQGQVWQDVDGAGQRDAGEVGLDGQTVELVNVATGNVMATQLSAGVDLDGSGDIDPMTEAGLYAFLVLVPGIYVVRLAPPTGWRQTAPTPPIYPLSLDHGDNEVGIDFGATQRPLITGRKFEDLNANGQADPGEPGLNNWTIELVDTATGLVIDTTLTADLDLDGSGEIDPITETGH